MFIGAFWSAALAIPLFYLVGGASLGMVIAIRLILVILGVVFAAPYHAWAIERVAPEHRYTILCLGSAPRISVHWSAGFCDFFIALSDHRMDLVAWALFGCLRSSCLLCHQEVRQGACFNAKVLTNTIYRNILACKHEW